MPNVVLSVGLIITSGSANVSNGSITLAIYNDDLLLVKEATLSVDHFYAHPLISTNIVLHEKFSVGFIKVSLTMSLTSQRLKHCYNIYIYAQVSSPPDNNAEWKFAEVQTKLNDEAPISFYVSTPTTLSYSHTSDSNVTAVYFSPFSTFMQGKLLAISCFRFKLID